MTYTLNQHNHMLTIKDVLGLTDAFNLSFFRGGSSSSPSSSSSSSPDRLFRFRVETKRGVKQQHRKVLFPKKHNFHSNIYQPAFSSPFSFSLSLALLSLSLSPLSLPFSLLSHSLKRICVPSPMNIFNILWFFSRCSRR